MKSLLLAALTSGFIANGGNTIQQPNAYMPQKCPDIKIIIAEGLDHLTLEIKGPEGPYRWRGIKENSQYDTNEHWTVDLSDTNGFKKAKQEMPKLLARMREMRHFRGPTPLGNITACAYGRDTMPGEQTDDGVMIAYTPSSYD